MNKTATMKRIFTLILTSVLAGLCLDVFAAAPSQAADSLAGYSFDANDYSLMKRWRPEDQVEFEKKGGRNMFVGLTGTAYKPLHGGYSSGPHFSVNFGKWFDPYNGLRIAPGAGYYFNNSTSSRVKQLDLKASYLFNISSYVGGYKPTRFMEISAVAGLGYAYRWSPAYTGHSLTAHVGFNFSMHVLRNVYLFAEPQIELSVDGLGKPNSAVAQRLTPYFTGAIGVGYRFNTDKREWLPQGKWFFTLAGGTQFLTAGHVFNEMTANKAFGMHFAFGAGRRYWHWFALRLSVAYSQHNWDQNVYGDGMQAKYAVGRLEAMVDLVSLIGGRGDNRFCVSLMVGPEAGLMKHAAAARNIMPFVGITGGAQVKTRLSRSVALFIEPRISMVPYPAKSSATGIKAYNCYDGVFNCNIGIEYSL